MSKKYYTDESIQGDLMETWTAYFLKHYGINTLVDDSSKHPEYDLVAIDSNIKIEVKSCTNALVTGNYFIEVIDDIYTDKKGNLLTCEADILIYCLLDKEKYSEYPVLWYPIDFTAMKEHLITLYKGGELSLLKKSKYNNKILQGFFLVPADIMIPFIIKPSRLRDFCAYKTIIGDDIPSEYYLQYDINKKCITTSS